MPLALKELQKNLNGINFSIPPSVKLNLFILNMKTKSKKILKKIDSKIYRMISGNPTIPPSYEIKRQIIEKYESQFDAKIFIETGTYLGDTVFALKDKFKKLISIELDINLFEKSKERLGPYKHIELIQGDSSKVLPSIINEINEPILFWLDGHYSGIGTAKGEGNTPILKELDIILNHHIKNHVILIDDARCFIGESGYPTIEELQKFVYKINNKMFFSVENDIIRITSADETGKNIRQKVYHEPFRQKLARSYRFLKQQIKKIFFLFK